MKRFPIAAFAASLPGEGDREAFACYARQKGYGALETFVDLQENRRDRGLPYQVRARGRWLQPS